MAQKVSVTLAMLAMNHEKYILQTCESIAAQTYADFEVLFLDNNSTDRTFEIADEFFKKSNIKYRGIKNTVNKNVSQNMNILVDEVTTEYITFLSGDDWYTPDNMEKKIGFMLSTAADVVFTDGYKYFQDTGLTTELYDKRNKKRVLQLHNFFSEAITGNFLYAIGFITKRQILLDNKFDETILMEDWDICLRLSQRGYKMEFLDAQLFYYRIMSSSLSNNKAAMEHDYALIINKFIDHINADRKIYKKYWLRRHKTLFRAIEQKEVKDADDKAKYADHKIAYAKLKYPFPVNFLVSAYWKLKK